MQYADVGCVMLTCKKIVICIPADVSPLMHDSQRLDVIRKFYFVILNLLELYELCLSVNYLSPMYSK